jgi:hypothetical protein
MSEYLLTQDVPLVFGGRVFERITATVQSISGYYLGADIAMVPHNIERLVTAPPLMPRVPPVSPEYAHTLEKFHQHETMVISEVESAMQSKSVEPAYVKIANLNLTRMISSALILGDINLLDHSIIWLNGLLDNYGLSSFVAENFYATYRQAVERHLGVGGAIILDWLAKLQLPD